MQESFLTKSPLQNRNIFQELTTYFFPNREKLSQNVNTINFLPDRYKLGKYNKTGRRYPVRPKPRLHPAIKHFQFFFPFPFWSCRSQLDIRPYDNYCSCQLWYLPSGSSGTGFPGISSLIIAELESSLLSQQRQGNTTVSPSLFVTVTSSTNMVRPRPYPSSPMRSLVIYKTWRKYLGYDISRSRKIFEGTNFYLRNLFTRNRANSVTVPITPVRTNFCQFLMVFISIKGAYLGSRLSTHKLCKPYLLQVFTRVRVKAEPYRSKILTSSDHVKMPFKTLHGSAGPVWTKDGSVQVFARSNLFGPK